LQTFSEIKNFMALKKFNIFTSCQCNFYIINIVTIKINVTIKNANSVNNINNDLY